MKTLLPSPASTIVYAATPTTTIPTLVLKLPTSTHQKLPPLAVTFPMKTTPLTTLYSISNSRTAKTEAASTSSFSVSEDITASDNRHWMVLLEGPSQELTTKPQIIDFYVSRLESIFCSEQDAQRCMYHVSCNTHYGFCCEIDEETACKLASLPGILSVKPDPDVECVKKDYSYSKLELNNEPKPLHGSSLLFPVGTAKHWVVRMERPAIGVIRKAQVVDYYVQVLMRVLRNEKDAQMCMYDVSWQFNYGFCCDLDHECAQELAAVPGVLSVEPDDNFWSDDKDYRGVKPITFEDSSASSVTTDVKTKKLFVTGLSFYTSEKTLRAAFEGFGELVEVKIIMDKISKRSRGYAFMEYTSEEAAATALREMNGKIINGWMITVDVAKKNPPKYTRRQPNSSL